MCTTVKDNSGIMDTADFEMDLDINNGLEGFGEDDLILIGTGEVGVSMGGRAQLADYDNPFLCLGSLIQPHKCNNFGDFFQ